MVIVREEIVYGVIILGLLSGGQVIIQGKVVLEPKSILIESLKARQREEANAGI